MSTTIDNKVVEMRFDNRNFESNVKTTLNSIEKLKQSLKFDGVKQGFENINNASKSVNLNGLQNGVETIKASFSAMDVVAVTALANITNAAIRAGSRIVSALTIDPIRSGLSEYETQINSVQTILSNTRTEGTNVEIVNKALDELNRYADQTIYNFTEMTRNIGTFTAAGVKLDTSVSAIKGIANLAALSGSTSQQASNAMYQLSQALAAGKVQLMDWNSVVNAGMGGKIFQDALIRTSELLGTGAKAAVETAGSFRESLTKTGWLTTEVLTETLKQLSGAYSEAELIAQGYTDAQAKEIMSLAKDANAAATEVKTVTQMWEVLQETAQSGWSTTWKLIVGDFKEAKNLFTPLTTFFSDIIQSMSDARNSLLESTMGKTFSDLAKNVTGALKPIEKVTTGVGKVVDTVTDLGAVVDDVVLGKFGSGKDRFDALTNAGLNYYEIQNRVNEKLGDSVRYTQDQIDAQNKVLGIQENLNSVTEDASISSAELGDSYKDQLKTLSKLSTEQMRSLGYTESQIEAFETLRSTAKKLGMPIEEFIDRIDELDGRTVLLESFGNVIESIHGILSSIGNAFKEVFKPVTSDQLFDVIAGFHRLTESLIVSDEKLDALKRTFKGVFGIFKIFTTFIGGGFRVAFEVITGILEVFDLHILDVTAAIGDIVYGFSEFISSGKWVSTIAYAIFGIFKKLKSVLSNFTFEKVADSAIDFYKKVCKAFDGSAKAVHEFAESIKKSKIGKLATDTFETVSNSVRKCFDKIKKTPISKWFESIAKIIGDSLSAIIDGVKRFTRFMSNLTLDDIIKAFTEFGKKVKDVFTKLKDDFVEIGPNLISGLQNGLSENIEKIFEAMKNIGTKIIETIKDVLGIHSPSTVMYEIGQNIIQGLINGISSLINGVADLFRGIGGAIQDAIGPIDWGAIAVGIFGIGAFVTMYKMVDALQGFSKAAQNATAPARDLGKIFASISETIDAVTGKIKGTTKLQNAAIAIKMLAESIVIVAAAAGALTLLDQGKLWSSVGAIAALSAVLAAITSLFTLMPKSSESVASVKLSGIVLALGASFVLLAAAAKIMGSIDPESFENAKKVLSTFGVCLIALTVATKLAGNNFDKTAAMLSKVGGCFILLGVSARILGGLSEKEMMKAKEVVTSFGLVISLLIMATKFAGNDIESVAKIISKIGSAFLLLSITAKIIGTMSTSETDRARDVMASFGLIVAMLIAVTKFGGSHADKVSSFISKIGAAFLLLGISAKIAASIDPSDYGKIATVLIVLGVVIAGLVSIIRLAPPGEISKISATLISMALAIGILAGVSALIGMVKPKNLAKGLVAVSILSVMLGLMTKMSKGAGNIKGTMVGIAIAIGVMTVSIAALSFIEPKKLIAPTLAIFMLMGMMSLVESQAGKAKKAVKSMAIMVVFVGVLGLVMYALKDANPSSVLASALSISLVIGAICAMMYTVKQIGPIAAGSLASLGVMTAVVAAIGAVFFMLKEVEPSTALANTTGIILVIGAMTVALFGLKALNGVTPQAMLAMVGMTAIVAALGGILFMMNGMDPQGSLANAAALSTLLLSISASMAIMVGVSAVAAAAVAGLVPLAGFFVALGGIVAACALIANDPGNIEAVNRAGELLEALGQAIGKFVGGLVGGVLEGLTSSLIGVADNLSAFIMHLTPFIVGIKMVDPSAQASVEALVGMLMPLTAASFVNGILDFFNLGINFGEFGDKLVPFGEAMMRYSNAVSGIDGAAVESSAIAGKAISELYTALSQNGGQLSGMFGTADMPTFGTQLVSFGESLKAYSLTVAGLDVASIQSSVDAGQSLSDLASALPKNGGLASIFGTKDSLADFGTQLNDFGIAIKNYSTNVQDLNIDGIRTSVEAGRMLNELASNLGGDGGILAIFTGGNTSLSGFGNDLKNFGNALKEYSTSLGDVDFSKIGTATKSAERIKNFAGGLVDFDYSGLNGFNNIKKIGLALKEYYSKIEEVELAKLETSTSIAMTIASSMNSMAIVNTEGLISLKNGIDILKTVDIPGLIAAFETATGQAFLTGFMFVKTLSDGFLSGLGVMNATFNLLIGSAVAYLVSMAGRFIQIGVMFIDKIVNGLMSRRASVNLFFTTMITSIISLLTGYATLFTSAGQLLVTSMRNGIKNNSSRVAASIVDAVKSALSDIRSYHDDFYAVGEYLVLGFANGISDNTFRAKAKAQAMANAAKIAASNELKVASPSKEFFKIGAFVSEGFALGIESLTGRVTKSATNISDTVLETAMNAISTIDTINYDGIGVAPRIRPVIDMDAIPSSADDIRIRANLDATLIRPISSLSNLINDAQNDIVSSNQEVINAINNLRDDLNSLYSADDQELAFYVDSKKLASTLAKPMNRQLSILARRGD